MVFLPMRFSPRFSSRRSLLSLTIPFSLFCAFGMVSTLSCLSVAYAAPTSQWVVPMNWDTTRNGGFLNSLLEDGQGNIWAATDDNGVWRYSSDPRHPHEKLWTDCSLEQGVGDTTVSALAQDRKGRIWAGTQHAGISVWNGQSWRNYGVMDGPLGGVFLPSRPVLSMAMSGWRPMLV